LNDRYKTISFNAFQKDKHVCYSGALQKLLGQWPCNTNTTEMDIENLKQCLQGHGIHYKPGPLPLKGFLMDRLIGRGVSEVGQFPMPTWVRVGPLSAKLGTAVREL